MKETERRIREEKLVERQRMTGNGRKKEKGRGIYLIVDYLKYKG